MATYPRHRILSSLSALMLAACGPDGPSAPIEPIEPITVAVSPGSLTLLVGESKPLAVDVQGTTRGSVTWSTSSSGIATVTTAGVVTGNLAGTATIIATSVADPSKTGKATITVADGPVDFIMDVVTAPPTAVVGGPIEITSTLRNLGGFTRTVFTAGIYFSTDATITTTDLFTNYACTYQGMEANFTSTCGGTMTVPPAMSAGTYWVGVIVDDRSRVVETDETNNAKGAAEPTVFTAAP